MTGNGRLRKVVLWLCLPIALCGLLLLWFIHDIQNLKVGFFSERDVSNLITVVKGTAARALVVKQPSDQRLPPALPVVQNVQIDAARFQVDAKLFDAWSTELRMAQEALQRTRPGAWAKSSAELANLSAANRADPWGHYVCVFRRGDTLAVLSAGPKSTGSPMCKNINMAENELAQLPKGRLLETPAGNLMLVLVKGGVIDR